MVEGTGGDALGAWGTGCVSYSEMVVLVAWKLL